jgi:hypothetical protein
MLLACCVLTPASEMDVKKIKSDKQIRYLLLKTFLENLSKKDIFSVAVVKAKYLNLRLKETV